MPLKVLVVDDTAVFRRVVADALAAIPGVSRLIYRRLRS